MMSTDTSRIRNVIQHWEKAIQAGDIKGILANHTKDVLMFDVPVPLQSRGLEEYRNTWNLFFRYGAPASDVFVIKDLRITSGSDVAFATGLLCIGGSTPPQCRLTLGLEKVDGDWLIAHEHHSAPHKLDEQVEGRS